MLLFFTDSLPLVITSVAYLSTKRKASVAFSELFLAPRVFVVTPREKELSVGIFPLLLSIRFQVLKEDLVWPNFSS